jgi:hypothetical protein
VGSDFWPVYKDRQGRRRAWIWDRYPQSLWHSCNLMSHMLVPGPAGPVASTRYELMREGIQECEARIAIESVLTDEAKKAKLPVDLAQQSQQLLDDRVCQELKAFSNLKLCGQDYATAKNPWFHESAGLAGHYWYASSGWRDNAQKLYALAGEVERKAGRKQAQCPALNSGQCVCPSGVWQTIDVHPFDQRLWAQTAGFSHAFSSDGIRSPGTADLLIDDIIEKAKGWRLQ